MTAYQPTPFNFALIPGRTPEELLGNVRYALSLGLPDLQGANDANNGTLCIVGGGPSLEDTWPQLEGHDFIATANGTLSFLKKKGLRPYFCGVCHPTESIADEIEADPEVKYFLGSCVHPKVFDKLLAANCKIVLWHLHPIDGLDEVLNQHYGDKGWVQIPGGTTMGLRWITLGYHLGFRKFHLHGLDSSFRDKSSHAYPHHQDHKEWINYDGYMTRIPFLGQVEDFLSLMHDGQMLDDPPQITMFGDGLLQMRYSHWLKANQPFEWPGTDRLGRRVISIESRSIPEFMKLIPKRGTCIQAGGNVGVYPRALAGYFDHVITFEPDKENYRCLVKNVSGQPNVRTIRAALGDEPGFVSTSSHEDGNSGAVHVIKGSSTVVHMIDHYARLGCDLIWLDVEGYEELALKGAAQTIEKFKPAVIIEVQSPHRETSLAEMHGLEPTGAIKWLKERQYHRVARYGNDCLYVYGGA